MKGKGGQAIMVGIMVMIMALIVFIATIPAMSSIINSARQSDSLNCAGYVSPTDETKSYNASLQESFLACTILDLGIPYLTLGVLIGLVAKLLSGKLVEPEQQQPMYSGGGYPQY